MTKLIFFGSLFILFYIYFGYPVLVFLLSKFRPKQVSKGLYQPNVSILISAYNEERNIEETIKNKLNLNYPKDKMEIIVISDGSIDRTDDIVKKYVSEGVRLFRQESRSGKTSALNLGVKKAKGEMLIFSDANSMYDNQALQRLVQNFNDPEIGYVTGKMIYTNTDGTAIGDGCTLYMKYENFLRKFESRIGSIVGVDGAIDAIRKSLYKPMNPDQLPDFVLPLRVIEQGFRVVYEPEAILKEAALKSPQDEYRMRVRVSLRALWALSDMRQLLTFKKFRLFAWQLWSHKVLRYLCFIFLVGAYLGNLTLLHESDLYKITFAVQNIAYLGAFLSPLLEKRGHRLRILYVINYFSLLNIAAAHAFMKFMFGQKQVIWTPRKGI